MCRVEPLLSAGHRICSRMPDWTEDSCRLSDPKRRILLMTHNVIDAPAASERPTQLDQPVATPAGDQLSVRAYGLTDRGQQRPGNEDQFLIATLTKALQVQQASLRHARTRYADQKGHLFV